MNTNACGLIAVLVVAPIALAGCDSSSGGGPGPGTPTLSSQPSSSTTQDEIAAALLTPTDLGAGFTKAEFRPSSNPLPCLPTGAPLEEKFSATVSAGTALVSNAGGASFSEEVRLYPDEATAQQVVAYISQGLDCRTGQLALTGPAQTIDIGKQQDITSTVNADGAFAVQTSAPRFNIVLAAARLGRSVTLFAFLKTKSTPDSALPNPIQVVAKALDKIRS
ncbi:MAG: hypothetical protein QOI15_2226 [Pseudonocardiales bacterium]|nr:hypothetical protein [Pseudonocardiales bacterium]MDT4921324.1 hypothetical protein [Pseudonocardiales bacterium]MDT4940703.1 hypothetical protein [Pseudonocardiales bacterium]